MHGNIRRFDNEIPLKTDWALGTFFKLDVLQIKPGEKDPAQK